MNITNPIKIDFKSKSLDFGVDMDNKGKLIHLGIDYLLEKGTPVYSASSGKVITGFRSSYNPYSFGSFVIIKSKEYYFIYAHLGKRYVTEGHEIQKGDLIGRTGNTGYSYNPSLHFSIMKDDFYINPDLIIEK